MIALNEADLKRLSMQKTPSMLESLALFASRY